MDNPLQHDAIKELQSAIDAEEARAREGREPCLDALNQARDALDRLSGLFQNEAEAADAFAQTLRQKFEDALHALTEICGEDATAVQAARDHAAQLQQEADQLRQELAAQETRATEAEADSARLREEIASLQSETQALSGRIEESEDARKTAESKIEDLHADVAGAQARADAAQAGHDDLEAELESLRTELETLRTADDEAPTADQVEELVGRLAEATAHIETLEHQLQEEEERRQSLDSSLKEAQARGVELELRLQEEMAKSTRSVLAEQLAVALREAEEAQEELRRLKAISEDMPLQTPGADSDKLPEQRIREAARQLGDPSMASLGEILICAGLVTQEQVETAADEQKQTPNRHIGAILIDRELVAEESVAQALAIQCGVAYTRINEKTVDPEAAALISERLANQHCCIPLSATGDTLLLGIVNPLNLVALEDIERATGRKVTAVAATASDIKQAIEKYYWEPE